LWIWVGGNVGSENEALIQEPESHKLNIVVGDRNS